VYIKNSYFFVQIFKIETLQIICQIAVFKNNAFVELVFQIRFFVCKGMKKKSIYHLFQSIFSTFFFNSRHLKNYFSRKYNKYTILSVYFQFFITQIA